MDLRLPLTRNIGADKAPVRHVDETSVRVQSHGSIAGLAYQRNRHGLPIWLDVVGEHTCGSRGRECAVHAHSVGIGQGYRRKIQIERRDDHPRTVVIGNEVIWVTFNLGRVFVY